MPSPFRDPHSGALLFVPTLEEQEQAQTIENLKALETELTEKLARVDALLASQETPPNEEGDE